MSELLVKKLSSSAFDADKYVHEISLSGDSYADLQVARGTIQNLADETNSQMKKNVYKNYTQFIETAKEISYLESEMYQLSHMLTEQKSVMSSLLEISVASDKGISEHDGDVKDEEETKKNLTELLETVEGCARIMEIPGRYLLQSGELLELDPQSHSSIDYIKMFLLNDSVVIATALPVGKRGPVGYKFQSLYELDNVAIVNIKDTSNIKNGIEILMFPHNKLFQCPDLPAKKMWLNIFEKTKKKRSQADIEKKSVLESNPYVERLNPFTEEDTDGNPFSDTEQEHPEWLKELPEDLDVSIAERDFEHAASLIDKAHSHFQEYPDNPSLTELRVSIENRTKHLTQVLMNELRVTQDRTLQGGPRAVRRAVSLLIKLGKSIQACDLFLKHRSAVLKHHIKQLKIEGSTVMYIRRMSSVFFNFLLDTGKEFLRAFPKNNNCASAFIVWSHSELKTFANALTIQVFTSTASLSTIAECVSVSRGNCEQLKTIGLDLTFLLDTQVTPQIKKVILDARDKMLEAIRLRSQEEKWRPMNHQNKAGITKFLDDMKDIGIASIHTYIYDECLVSLTNNSVQFSKAYINFLEDVLKLNRQDLSSTIDNCLVEIFQAQLSHLEQSLANPANKNEVKFIHNNGKYLLDTLLNLVEHKYAESTKVSCPNLSDLRTNSSKLSGSAAVTKYSSAYL
ncbi:Exocyst complex component 8 [Nymphon striatum]|nr:Exocyst complex component 8 [Nymphon striatum]